MRISKEEEKVSSLFGRNSFGSNGNIQTESDFGNGDILDTQIMDSNRVSTVKLS